MAETVVINIEANTTGLQSTIDLLVKLGQVEQKVAEDFRKTNEQNVKNLQQGVQQTAGQFDKLGKSVKSIKGDNKLAESLDATAPLAKTANSIKSFRQQLKDATTEAVLLAQKFGELDPRAIAAAQKVADLKDQINDTNQRINALNPENKFKAIQNLGGAIAGIFQVATGALQAFGVESEQATKIAQQFQGALNIFGGISQLAQLKDSLTAVKAAFGITAASSTVATTAIEGQTVAQGELAAANLTEAATAETAAAATGTLSAAFLASPIGLFVAGVAALSAALILLSDDADNAAAKIDNLNNQADVAAAGLAGELSSLERSRNQINATIQADITSKQAQGASVKELAELERQKFQNELNYIDSKTKANLRANEEDKGLVNELRKVNDEASIAEIRKIEDRIDARDKENKDLASQAKIAREQIRGFEAQLTQDLAKEAEEQKKARQAALEVDYQKAIEANKNAFAREKIIAQETIQDQVQLRLALTNLTIQEKQRELAINQQYGKETIAVEQQIFDARKDFSQQLAAEGLQQDLNNLQDYLDQSLNAIKESYDERDKTIQEATQKQLEANLSQLQQGLISYEDYEKKKNEIIKNTPDTTKQRAIATTQAELTGLELRLQNFKDYGKDTADIEKQIADKKAQLQKQITDNEKAENAKRLSDAEATELAKLEAAAKAKELRDKLSQDILNLGVDTFIKGVNDAFEAQIGNIQDLKEAQLEAIDEEDERIQESYDNRLIGKRQFELEQERLTNERVKAEERAEKRINNIRKAQDIANKAKALFEIVLNTRRAVTAIQADPTILTAAKPALITATIIFGGIQAASVLATPLPKYKKGTLSVPGTGTQDSEMAMLQPGEAVIPTETNKKYHPAIKAIYEQKISAKEINTFVREKMFDKRAMPSELKEFVSIKLKPDMTKEVKPDAVTAKMDVSDLYALGRIMRKNDGVTVKNIKELASIFADNYNPRR